MFGEVFEVEIVSRQRMASAGPLPAKVRDEVVYPCSRRHLADSMHYLRSPCL